MTGFVILQFRQDFSVVRYGSIVWGKSRDGFHGKFVVCFLTAYPAMLERCMVPAEIKIMAFQIFCINQYHCSMTDPVIIIRINSHPKRQGIIP